MLYECALCGLCVAWLAGGYVVLCILRLGVHSLPFVVVVVVVGGYFAGTRVTLMVAMAVYSFRIETCAYVDTPTFTHFSSCPATR